MLGHGNTLFEMVKVVPVAIKDANNEVVTSAVVDTSGYEGVAFVAVAAQGEDLTFSLQAQQATQADFSDGADVGSAVSFATTTTADGHAVLDVYQPQARYVRVALTVPTATAAKAVSIVALLYGAREVPVGNDGALQLWPS